jgi:hypothetical protein
LGVEPASDVERAGEVGEDAAAQQPVHLLSRAP